MRSYQVGVDQYYFREIGQKLPIGSVIELRPGDAERYMVSHPGLLKPLPMTAQARPQAVRSMPEAPAPAESETPAPVAEPEAPKEEPKAEVADEQPAAEPAPAETTAETPKADEGDAKPKAKSRAKK